MPVGCSRCSPQFNIQTKAGLRICGVVSAATSKLDLVTLDIHLLVYLPIYRGFSNPEPHSDLLASDRILPAAPALLQRIQRVGHQLSLATLAGVEWPRPTHFSFQL